MFGHIHCIGELGVGNNILAFICRTSGTKKIYMQKILSGNMYNRVAAKMSSVLGVSVGELEKYNFPIPILVYGHFVLEMDG